MFQSNLLQPLTEKFSRGNNFTFLLSESYWNPVIRVRPLLTKKLLHLSNKIPWNSKQFIIPVPSYLAYFNFLYNVVNFNAFLLAHVLLVHPFYFPTYNQSSVLLRFFHVETTKVRVNISQNISLQQNNIQYPTRYILRYSNVFSVVPVVCKQKQTYAHTLAFGSTDSIYI